MAARSAAHPAASAFVAVSPSSVFTSGGVSSGCFDRISAQMPEMCGVAKLLPLARSVEPSDHATSTSTPRA